MGGACFCQSYACPSPCQNPLGSYCNTGATKVCARNHKRLGIPSSLKPFGGLLLERSDRNFEGHRRNLHSLKQRFLILLGFLSNLVNRTWCWCVFRYNWGSAQSVVMFSYTGLVQAFKKIFKHLSKKEKYIPKQHTFPLLNSSHSWIVATFWWENCLHLSNQYY